MDIVLGATTLVNCQRWQEFKEQCELDYPGSFWREYAHIFAPDRRSANALASKKGEELAIAAYRFRRKLVRIFWSMRDADKPIPIRPKTRCSQSGDFTTMSTTQSLSNSIFGNAEVFRFTKSLLDAMGRILDSDRPMAIIRLRDQKQLFLNQKFSDMLATPPEVATTRTMKLGWNPAHLEECNRRIRQEGRFEFSYDSALNPKVYGRQTSIIELIDDGVEQYRLNTNQGLEILDWPDHMKQLQQFDW
jgi:PAS domain-containing protein